MKNIKMIPLLVALVAVLATGCSNANMESRIAKLEGRVAELEGASTANARSTASTSNTVAPEPETKPEGPLPEFLFEKEDHDFGTINEGDVVEYVFSFTNSGDAPLIISSASGSCGCTVPDWPKEPIGVGEKGEIKVKFNSRKKPGIQNKTVTITSNTWPKQKRIKIKANVTPAPKEGDSPS